MKALLTEDPGSVAPVRNKNPSQAFSVTLNRLLEQYFDKTMACISLDEVMDVHHFGEAIMGMMLTKPKIIIAVNLRFEL